MKFTPDGQSVTVSIASVNHPLIGAAVKVDVNDTGIGISPEALQYIFEKFRQAVQGGEREYSGSGLGLALAKNFTELHGGIIQVDSEVGVGSTFSFTIPIKPKEG